jgi:DNA-binding NarL/FixJ family response regulator
MPECLPGVVIVDDHPGFRRAARELLEARGFAVYGEAPGAAEAYFLVELRRPDLVIVDVRLGELNGLDVAWTLTHEHPGLRVLLVSACEDACDFTSVMACGAVAFLPKEHLGAADFRAFMAAP